MAASTTSSISVAAPAAAVLAVIADFAAYPEWASAVRSAEVTARDPAGQPTRVRFQLEAGVVKDSYVLGYDWEPAGAGVRWHLAEPGSVVSVMDGAYRLTGDGGSTDVSYELTVDLRIPIPGMLKRRAEKTIIDTALRGLKRRAEGGTR